MIPYIRSVIQLTKIAHYFHNGQYALGLIQSGLVYNVAHGAKGFDSELESSKSLDEVLSKGLLDKLKSMEARIVENDEGSPTASLKLASPILFPEKILCVAVNYRAHGSEQEMKPPPEPYFFTKFRNTLIGAGETILIPKISNKVDWEVELAAVIGRKGKYIPRNEAHSYIAGYTISNDISFRDYQFPLGYPEKLNPLGMNWVKGKGMDAAFPLGPWVVTADEIEDPYSLDISLSVNGKMKQHASTCDLIFKIDSLVEYISSGITLLPGDIISTGTPSGVAAFTDQQYLRDGDVIEASISKIGTLRNPVIAE